jgi:hypothetical protein
MAKKSEVVAEVATEASDETVEGVALATTGNSNAELTSAAVELSRLLIKLAGIVRNLGDEEERKAAVLIAQEAKNLSVKLKK